MTALCFRPVRLHRINLGPPPMQSSNLVLSVLAASCCLLAGSATARTLYEEKNGQTVEIYGQVNPTVQSFDDGEDTTTNLVDNARSNTRAGFWLRGPTEAGSLSFNFETALGAPSSSGFSQKSEPTWDWDRTKLRKIDFSLRTDRLGTFTIGQGSMATDGVAGNDLSGTTLGHNVSINDGAGRFRFRNSDSTLSDIEVRSVNGDLDGGRRSRFRYDTPVYGGFTFSAAYGRDILSEAPNADEDEFYDIALTYKQDHETFETRAGIGYAVRDRFKADEDKDTVGSISILFDSGLNVTFAAGSREDGGSYGYGKLGYRANWVSFGTTALSADYYESSDFNGELTDDDFKSYGLAITQSFDAHGVQAYLAAQKYDLSATGRSFQKATSYFLGARWRF